MKNRKFSLIIFFCLVFTFCDAQVLTGYVKTKGRIGEDGKVIPGKALSGVIIQVVGANPVISKEDGSFSLSILGLHDGDSFRIQSIKKNGYELQDKSLIGTSMVFSSRVPWLITMLSSEQLQSDKLRIANNTYRTAEKNYKNNIALLEKQLADGTITVELYREKLQSLQDKLEKSQSTIEGLAERCARTDYDQLDSLERVINIYIENGELEKADSIIHMVFDPEDVLMRNREAKEIINHELSQSDAVITTVLEQQNKDAENLYQLSKISMARLDDEKALFYIETRANLDSTNVTWQIDAGSFIVDYVMDQNNEDKAKNYLQRAMKIITTSNGSNSKENLAKIYHSLGNLFYQQVNYGPALDNYIKALNYYPQKDVGYAQCVERIAIVYSSMKEYKEAEKHHQIAIESYSKIYGQLHKSIAECYNNIGILYKNRGDDYRSEDFSSKAEESYTKAEECYSLALKISAELKDSITIADCYTNLGGVYDRRGLFDNAVDCYRKSIDTYKGKYGQKAEEKKSLAAVYNNLGYTFYNMSDYINAITCYAKALMIMRRHRAKDHTDIIMIKANINDLIEKMSQ